MQEKAAAGKNYCKRNADIAQKAKFHVMWWVECP